MRFGISLPGPFWVSGNIGGPRRRRSSRPALARRTPQISVSRRVRVINGLLLLLIVAGIVALAACGSSTRQDQPVSGPAAVRVSQGAPVPPAQAANPVTVLKKTGCPVPASEQYGNVGLANDRDASCTFPNNDSLGETVTVFTYDTQGDMQEAIADSTPQDGETSIEAPGNTLLDVDVDTSDPSQNGASPQVIAQRVGGHILQPNEVMAP
jgi:hypothetical protein